MKLRLLTAHLNSSSRRESAPFFRWLLIAIALSAFAGQTLCAQSADDFFHTGAQAYLTNNTATAREQVDKGLKLYPNDVKLKKLDQLLKQQKQQQQQQQQKNQQQQNQSQQNQSQSKEDQKKQQDQKKQDEQKKQDQEKKDQEKKDQQQDQKPEKNDDKQPPKDQQPTPGEMSPDEAKKLLDSQKGDEKLLPANENKQGDRRHLKDW